MLPKDQAQAALDMYARTGSEREAARNMNLARETYRNRLEAARRYGLTPHKVKDDAPSEQKLSGDANVLRIRNEALSRELRDLRNEHRKLQENNWTIEQIKQLIHDGKKPPTPPKWLIPKSQPNLTGIPHLFASDFHWDEVVDPRQINGVNAFNREIAIRRCEHLFKQSTNLLLNYMAHPHYDYITLILGGDMLSGNIHEELRETNAYPVTMSMLSVVDYLIAGITLLHNAFGRVFIPCVVGNHGRIDKKPRAKNRAYDSFEWIVYHMLVRHFMGEDGINFNISDGPDLFFQSYGTRYLLTHGDQARGGSGIAGALSPLMLMDHRKRKRAMATNQDYDILILGHWHQYMHVKGMIINGAMKGYDEWAASMNFDYELPTQAVWITHPDHHVTAKWPIYLEKQGAIF